MDGFFKGSLFFGAFITISGYMAGNMLKKRFKLAVFNPLLIAMFLVMGVLAVLNIDYGTYEKGAGYVSFFLTPATVCLAVPLYRQIELLKKQGFAILCGILAGILANGVAVLALAVLMKLDYVQYATLLPKSITTPIGIGVSEELGGIGAVTAAVIVITGVVGSIMGEWLCRIFHIEEPAAKGIALGCASHVVGTTKAIEMGEIEGAVSSLSIVVSGVLTVAIAPFFSKLFFYFSS